MTINLPVFVAEEIGAIPNLSNVNKIINNPKYFSIIFVFMELKLFVTETIKEIIEGVVGAQKQVIPQLNHSSDGFVQIGSGSLSNIEFDISVTSSETDGSENKAGVFIKVLDIGHKNMSTNNNTSTNRIKFSVPVSFPTQANKKFT
jgi:hypothetical protein